MELTTESDNISKANKSFRWTTFSEIIAKILSPLMNMVLARLISSEVFGIVASVTIVTSFAELLCESGFSRYIFQHHFATEEIFKRASKTAFTCNLFFGLILCAIVSSLTWPVASILGCEGYELFLLVSAFDIPFRSVLSTESSLLRRDFRFKETGIVRIFSTLVGAIFKIVLAFLGHGMEGLIWGNIIASFIETLLLFVLLPNKRLLGFNKSDFFLSISDSLLFIGESFCTWLAGALDIILIGTAFDSSTVGLYKLSFQTEKGIVAILGAIFSPVLISLISKWDKNDKTYESMLSNYQRAISVLAIPLGVGIFILRDGLTNLFFGEGWEAAAIVLGAFGLTDCIKTCMSDFISTILISKGKPLYSILAQVVYLVFVVVCLVFAKQLGFTNFVILRAICSLVLIIMYCIFARRILRIRVWPFVKNTMLPLLCSIIMGLYGSILASYSSGVVATLLIAASCVLLYFMLLLFLDKNSFFGFFSIVFNKGSVKEKLSSDRVQQCLSKEVALKKRSFRISLRSLLSIFSICTISVCFCITSAFEFSKSPRLMLDSEVFGLSSKYSKNNNYPACSITYDVFSDELNNKTDGILADSFAFSSHYSSSLSYYGFSVVTKNDSWSEKNNVFHYADTLVPFDVTLVQAPTMSLSSVQNSSGQTRLESIGLYALFPKNSQYVSSQGLRSSFISQSLADSLLRLGCGNGKDYQSLLGLQLKNLNNNCIVISNIIADDASSWMAYGMALRYGFFAITFGKEFFDPSHIVLVSDFTNQPFVLSSYLRNIIGPIWDTKTSSLSIFLLNKDGFSASQEYSDAINSLLNSYSPSSFPIIQSVSSSFLLLLFLLVVSVLLVFYVSFSWGLQRKIFFLSLLFPFIFCGIICTLFFLIFGSSPQFFLYFGVSSGGATCFIAVWLVIVYYSSILLRRSHEKRE